MQLIKTVILMDCFLISLLQPAYSQEIYNYGQRKDVTFEQLKNHFHDPDMIYGPFTFWFWDEPLNPQKAGRMAKEMTRQHLNPGYAHARMNQAGQVDLPRKQWLSPLWFEAFDRALTEAENADCYFGYVDEYWWPSGRAAGRVLENNPDLWAVSLRCTTTDTTGPKTIELPPSFFTVSAQLEGDIPKQVENKEGLNPHVPAVIKSKTLKIIGSGKQFKWGLPEGNWRIYTFTRYYHPGADGGRLNYLDERVANEFIKLAHKPYADNFKDRMGKSIPGVFVDNEGDYGYKLAWSDTLDERYKSKWNRDIRLWMPLMLDEDIEGKFASARFCWFDTVSDIYSEYLGATSRWLESRGMYCISNLWEETLMWQAGAVGDFFKTQRTYSMPGTDCLALNALKIHDFKETQSVTEFENRRMQSEIMGAAGFWGFTPVTIKQVANSITTWGVSHVVPHGIFMTRKLSGNPWLPDWYEQNPMWEMLHLWNDFVRRASYVNSHGRTAADVLLINPMDSVWALSGPGAFDPALVGRVPVPAVMELRTDKDIPISREELKKYSAWWCPPEMDKWFCPQVHEINKVYTQAMLDLADGRIEYLIVDKHYIGQMELNDGKLVRGNYRFHTVIMPPMIVLPIDVAQKIVRFAHAGGNVYALGQLPTGSVENGMNDPAVLKLMQELAGCMTFKSCISSIKDLVEDGSEGLHSHIEFKSGKFPMLQQHRIIDCRNFFWLANNTGKHQKCTMLVKNVKGPASIWDCETGNVIPVKTNQIDQGCLLDLEFDDYEGYWLVFYPHGKSVTRTKTQQFQDTILKLDGPWHVKIYPPIQPPLEHKPTVPDIFNTGTEKDLADWRDWGFKRFSGFVTYTKDINIDKPEDTYILDLGRVAHIAEVRINNQLTGKRLWPPFKFDITGFIKPGKNNIEIRIGNLTNNNYGDEKSSGLFGSVVIITIENLQS